MTAITSANTVVIVVDGMSTTPLVDQQLPPHLHQQRNILNQNVSNCSQKSQCHATTQNRALSHYSAQ
jgi:hypothetical protein